MSGTDRDVRLSTAIVFTTNGDAMTRFYAEALALGPPDSTMPGHVGWDLGSVYVGLDIVKEHPGAPPSAVTLWFEVPDLTAAFDHAVTHGARPRMRPEHKPWGGFLASVLDPDGNVVGLSERR